MKKKLIFFSYNLGIGGIENALVSLLNRINTEKYDITLVLEKKEGEFLSKINGNINVVEYSLSNSKNIIFRKISNFTKRVIWSMKYKNKYDFSCCYATYSMACNKLAKVASKNSAIYIHSDYSNLYKDDEYKKFFEVRKIDKYRKIIFVSNESRLYFLKLFSNLEAKCITMNNFIDDKKILALSKEDISDIQRSKEILFTFVGRLDDSSKKMMRLLKLIKNLSNDFDIELWIIGDGNDRYMYEEYINSNNLSNIHMLGMKTNPYPYMKEADYIILTSDYEGFPIIYLESILLRKKIITTIDVSDEYISINNNFGYIISKDEDVMFKQVKDILNDDNLEYKDLDYDKMNSDRMDRLEKIFDEKI